LTCGATERSGVPPGCRPPSGGGSAPLPCWTHANEEVECAQDGVVHSPAPAGGEDGGAPVSLHPLQEVVERAAGVGVVAVFDLATLANERRRFVEEQKRAPLVHGVENTLEILLRFADVFAHDGSQVYTVEVSPQGNREAPGHRREGIGLEPVLCLEKEPLVSVPNVVALAPIPRRFPGTPRFSPRLPPSPLP